MRTVEGLNKSVKKITLVDIDSIKKNFGNLHVWYM